MELLPELWLSTEQLPGLLVFSAVLWLSERA